MSDGAIAGMKAMVYKQPGEMALEVRPYPVLGSNEVILRVNAVGICGSELHGYLGHDRTVKPGMIFGHEFAGTVVETTSPRFPVGTLVTSNSSVTCGNCDFCRQGRDNLCADRQRIGKARQGAFADYIAVPITALIELPQDMDPLLAALVEPMATAMHGLNMAARSLVRPFAEGNALVLGGGAIGFIAGLLLRYFGCRQVTLAEINADRRAVAKKYLDCAVYDPMTSEPEDASFDFVFDAVGASATLVAALRAVRRGGVVTEVGLQDREAPLDIQKLTRAGITLIGGANYPTTELRASVKAIAAGIFSDISWVEVRAFEEGPRAFAQLALGKYPFSKVILLPAAAAA